MYCTFIIIETKKTLKQGTYKLTFANTLFEKVQQ
jgi:hypothetical protein